MQCLGRFRRAIDDRLVKRSRRGEVTSSMKASGFLDHLSILFAHALVNSFRGRRTFMIQRRSLQKPAGNYSRGWSALQKQDICTEPKPLIRLGFFGAGVGGEIDIPGTHLPPPDCA